MSKVQELLNKYQESLKKAQAERAQAVQRANQLGVLIEQLNGAIYALNEAAKPEVALNVAPQPESAATE